MTGDVSLHDWHASKGSHFHIKNILKKKI